MLVVELQPAWILHSIDYRDTSRIVRCLTRDFGLVDGLMRGSRGGSQGSTSSRRRRVQGQLFQPLLLSLRGKGELLNVTQVDGLRESYRFNTQGYLSACYLNELVLSVLAGHDEHAPIYHDYSAALQQLSESLATEPALRIFEKRLLAHLGYGLILCHDRYGAEIDPSRQYFYNPEFGPQLMEKEFTHDVRDVVIAGESLLALHHESLVSPSMRREAKLLLRSALRWHAHKNEFRVRKVWREIRALRTNTRVVSST